VLFDAAVEAAILLVTVPTLVMNWRTQRAASALVATAAQGGPSTERWTTAVTMLARQRAEGPSSVEMRLGAIYSIEQIARDYQNYRAPAMDLLAAYVREHAQPGVAALEPSTEMQSVLTVLGRNGLTGLDLRRTVLWGVDLEGAGLVEANLYEARLRGARLAGARLMRSRLRSADLADADLNGADLTGAVLRGARLVGADLTGACLRGVDLSGADLRRARLSRANLREARLAGALLNEAVLDQAELSGTILDGVDLSVARLGPAVASPDHIWLPMVARPATN
jgi:hypothetical protein